MEPSVFLVSSGTRDSGGPGERVRETVSTNPSESLERTSTSDKGYRHVVKDGFEEL